MISRERQSPKTGEIWRFEYEDIEPKYYEILDVFVDSKEIKRAVLRSLGTNQVYTRYEYEKFSWTLDDETFLWFAVSINDVPHLHTLVEEESPPSERETIEI